MNYKRILLGGLAAGIVMNAIDIVVNVALLGEAWKNATMALNADMSKAETAGFGWMTVDLLGGFILVWLYAAIRPRFGAGPKTALIASFAVWAISHAMMASFVFMGLFPCELICWASVGGAVAIGAAGLVGGWIYREA